MKNKSVFCLILALLCPIFMLGQQISIEGKANVPNALVRLLTYDEVLTCHQTKVADTQSDKDGKFTLQAEIKEITPAQIAINLDRIDFILSPGASYNLEITIPDKGDVSFFEQEMPSLKINSANDGGFYSQFVAVQEFVDNFVFETFDKIYRGRQLSLLDTLDNQLVKNFGQIKNKYINDFVKYRKASMLMTVNAKRTLTEYFDNQEVLYMQQAYMDVLPALRNTIGSDGDFLSRNWQIAELVRMMNLDTSYNSNPQNQSQILKSLEQIEKTSKSKKNQQVAANIIKRLKELSYDSDAPAFSLKDKSGKIVQLSDYQDDMVLLQFVGSITPLVEYEFEALNQLHKQLNDTIQILTIADKESFNDYVQLFDKQGYNWPLLNLGDNILLLEDYHVMIYPAYVILKRKNRIGMSPAPSPDHNLDIQVRRISKYL